MQTAVFDEELARPRFYRWYAYVLIGAELAALASGARFEASELGPWSVALIGGTLISYLLERQLRARFIEPFAFEVEILDDRLRFVRYPFPPASVFPTGEVPAQAIVDVEPDAAPPQIFTSGGEFLFVPGPLRAELESFARRNALPLVRRHDVWDDILAPFLDTQLSERWQRRIESRLEAIGITTRELTRIRRRFGLRMSTYNIGLGLWDWVHLGMFDLFGALGYGSPLPRPSPRRFRRIYWEAMELAARGRAEPAETLESGSASW